MLEDERWRRRELVWWAKRKIRARRRPNCCQYVNDRGINDSARDTCTGRGCRVATGGAFAGWCWLLAPGLKVCHARRSWSTPHHHERRRRNSSARLVSSSPFSTSSLLSTTTSLDTPRRAGGSAHSRRWNTCLEAGLNQIVSDFRVVCFPPILPFGISDIPLPAPPAVYHCWPFYSVTIYPTLRRLSSTHATTSSNAMPARGRSTDVSPITLNQTSYGHNLTAELSLRVVGHDNLPKPPRSNAHKTAARRKSRSPAYNMLRGTGYSIPAQPVASSSRLDACPPFR
jgi:hypothetical protein